MNQFADPDVGRSFARYLGLSMQEIGAVGEGGVSMLGHAAVPSYLRTDDGSIAMGALLGLADSVAGLCGGLAALPGWVVSTNLMLRATSLGVVGPLALRSDLLRAGRNAVVTSVSIRDAGAGDRLVADGALTSAVLAPSGGPPVHDRPVRLDFSVPDLETTPPLAGHLGIRPVDATALDIELTEQLRNPWGILHGAATAALVDLTARHATGGSATTDTVLHFLAPGRVGPVRARAAVAGTRPDGSLVRIEVRDRGADERLLALAVATVRA